MCGIAGFVGQSALLAEPVIRRMSDALLHRGPDDGGFWLDHACNVALGHRRLSIVDLSPEGHQPMHSRCGRYVVVFNGEIYNFPAIRKELEQEAGGACGWRGHSDTEVLLAAIVQWGLRRALGKFVGMFAFALWDRRDRTLSLVRDRLGEKPLYYASLGSSFVFASELKALTKHPQWKGVIDRSVLALYMRHNYVPAPYTIYEDVFKLRPGSILTVDLNGHGVLEPREEEYWSLKDIACSGVTKVDTRSDAEVTDVFETLLRDAIKQQMVADVPLGAFLSGGIDSSTVVALMQAQTTIPVKTFTIGFLDGQCNEAEAAKDVAAHLGTDHTELYVTPAEAMQVIPHLPAIYDEPFADSSQIPTVLVAQLARSRVTVSLSGDGGDELLGGYDRYLTTQRIWAKMSRVPAVARGGVQRAMTCLAESAWDGIFAGLRSVVPDRYLADVSGFRVHRLAGMLEASTVDDMYKNLMSYWTKPLTIVREARELTTALGERSSPGLPDLIDRLMYVDSVTYLPDDILVKVDRAAMSVSLESRIPLLDHRIVEFAWSLPQNRKIRNGRGKWLLRKVLARYVPESLTDRPKKGFTIPLDSWLRGPLREWAEELLDEKRIRAQGYFDPGPIRRMWKDHLSGGYNRQFYLWNVLMFQAWLAAAHAAS